MGPFLTFEVPSDFAKAIQDYLPAGELVRATSESFICQPHYLTVKSKKGNPTQQKVDRVSDTVVLAVTNVALRLFSFRLVEVLSQQQEDRKQRYLARGMSEEKATKKARGINRLLSLAPIPEVSRVTSYQISDISSIRYSEEEPTEHVKNWWKSPVARVGVLTISCRGETIVVHSLFSSIVEVFRSLEAAKSGAAIASTITSVEESISRLKALLDEGVLTGEEFDRAKNALIGKAADVPESAATSLRQLNNLFLSGVLTEAEYRAKKFDVLAQSWS